MPTVLIKGAHLIELIKGTYSFSKHSLNEGWHKIISRCFIIKREFYANYFNKRDILKFCDHYLNTGKLACSLGPRPSHPLLKRKIGKRVTGIHWNYEYHYMF